MRSSTTTTHEKQGQQGVAKVAVLLLSFLSGSDHPLSNVSLLTISIVTLSLPIVASHSESQVELGYTLKFSNWPPPAQQQAIAVIAKESLSCFA